MKKYIGNTTDKHIIPIADFSSILMASSTGHIPYPQWFEEVVKNPVTGEMAKSIACIFNTGRGSGKHWVAAIIDLEDTKIRFGDSFGMSIPKEIQAAIEQWVANYSD